MPSKETRLQATSGTEWRRLREEGEPVELPSKHVACLRPISLLLLLERGKVPDTLSGMVSQLILKGGKPAATLETYQDFAELISWVCHIAFIEPRIVDDPQEDNEISIDDVGFEDRVFVFNWAQKEVQYLMPFRPEPSGDVADVAGSQQLPLQAEPDSGDPERLDSVLL